MLKFLPLILITLMVIVGLSWIFNPPNQSVQVSNQASPISNSASLPPDSCDSSLWKHISTTHALKIIDQCKTVTGTIANIKTEGDGDYHIGLKPDNQYLNLLNLQNTSKHNGELVLEPICQVKPAPDTEAVTLCANYSGPHFQIPVVGTHVRVTGSYVVDGGWGWMEIHPVSYLAPL